MNAFWYTFERQLEQAVARIKEFEDSTAEITTQTKAMMAALGLAPGDGNVVLKGRPSTQSSPLVTTATCARLHWSASAVGESG